MRVRLLSDIVNVMTKIDWECINAHQADLNKNVHVHCWGLNMTTYVRVKPETAEPVADTLELKMLYLFYFVSKSEKIAIMSGLQ